ncbi:MarR family winged helix-turn-helix transcriptional regulator [Streptomyces clavifer]|uniref:MarR family winged helix-turn-helix transcriptional regulator n=1 Tax=Streptomyces clavifer TaxID=68188 RepID=UPI002E80CDBE|nr:MarR family winged helix-turn-helix transcriptional regulator [Streptomyces clavifer]WUC26263.1 MarR family winged helix-turn-helix transcriptional regulator [Streptomyces clavifer]
MEPSASPGTTASPSGAGYAVVGISSGPTDWSRIFRAIADGDLGVETLARGPHPAVPGAARAAHSAPPPTGTAPRGVLDLNAYLVYATGKAARRRLTETLAPHGLRLWHLTALTMLADVGPQSKGDLASRLDMNQSDLARTVQDLDRAGHVVCTRDPADRRRIEVALTASGRSLLTRLNDDVHPIDEDLLAPLDATERAQFSSMLRRVHAHLGHPARDGASRG